MKNKNKVMWTECEVWLIMWLESLPTPLSSWIFQKSLFWPTPSKLIIFRTKFTISLEMFKIGIQRTFLMQEASSKRDCPSLCPYVPLSLCPSVCHTLLQIFINRPGQYILFLAIWLVDALDDGVCTTQYRQSFLSNQEKL